MWVLFESNFTGGQWIMEPWILKSIQTVNFFVYVDIFVMFICESNSDV